MSDITQEERDALQSSAIEQEPIEQEETQEVPEESDGEVKPEEKPLSNEDRSKLKAFDRLYAENKEMKEKLKTIKPSNPSNIDDTDKILEIQRATKDLDADEISELRLKAKAMGVSLEEAKNDANYKLWLNAKRDKVRKENQIPEPSSTSASFGTKEITQEMSRRERDDIMKKRLAALQRKGSEY